MNSGKVLSIREKEVLELISQGFTNKEIGSSLCISPDTVKSHRNNMLKKMSAKNAAHLINMSYRLGLLCASNY